MKVAVVSMGLSPFHKDLAQFTGQSRQDYADRYGYACRNFWEIPGDVPKIKNVPEKYWPLRKKFLLARELTDFDLVLFFASDVWLHENAPSLDYLVDVLGSKYKIAAVRTWEPFERPYLFGRHGHYDYVLQDQVIDKASLPHPAIAVNGDVLAFRPSDVISEFNQLFDDPRQLSDEMLINLDYVQMDRMHFLDSRWNSIWFYNKYRLGFFPTARLGIFSRIARRLINKIDRAHRLEIACFKNHYPNAFGHHFALEGFKMKKIVSQSLKLPR